jgi:probable rRNA maturation factor
MLTPSEDTPDPKRIHPYNVDVSLISDDEMVVLNRDYRQKNKPTDVLSFSLWEGDASLFASPEREQTVSLGDLVISLETAARQARDLNHSLQHELEFLAVHGTLHLLGYDHIRAADRRVMWRWQEEITEKMQSAK